MEDLLKDLRYGIRNLLKRPLAAPQGSIRWRRCDMSDGFKRQRFREH